MANMDEIETFIKAEVAKCKGLNPSEVNILAPLNEEIRLHGNDFMIIADDAHRRFQVKPSRNAYLVADLTIKQWAQIIYDELLR